MSLPKKIFFLLIFFLLLNIVSIYTFDYKAYLSEKNDSMIQSENQNNSFFTEAFMKIKDSFSSNEVPKKPFDLILTKKDSIVEISGLFPSIEDAQKVSNILNVNREGKLEIDDNSKIDDILLNKISLLMPSFKDFFIEGSTLSLINGEISLKGELKDFKYKGLLDSVISRFDFPIKTDVIVPKEVSDEDVKAIVQSTEPKKEEKKEVAKITKEDIQSSINKLLLKNKIVFERRSTQVTSESIIVIEKIAEILSKYPSFKVEVAGHTDSRGKDSLNKQISQDRANSVADILVSKGVDKQRVTAVGYGEEFPIAKDDENGLSEINRRVEFNILGE